MGNRDSSPVLVASDSAPVEVVSPHTSHYRALYADLTSPDSQGDPVNKATFRDRFASYFGGPSATFGNALYEYLFSSEVVVPEARFLVAMTKLRGASGSSDHHTVERMYFRMFSHGQDTINREDLTSLLASAALYALVIGSELHEKASLPRDHPLLLALVQAAWVHTHTEDVLSGSEFSAWVSTNCPRLLDGVREWINSVLTQDGGTLIYQLPSPQTGKDPPLQRQIDLCTLVWVLSTKLPMLYMGHRGESSKDKGKIRVLPVGGEWTCLYSSDNHGLSMNRFQHHCSDYKQPSLLSLTCYHKGEKAVYQFAIALDTEWRDGTYYYGGEDSMLVQLTPTYRPLKCGPKLVSLNEKQRGFPTGLRVLATDGSVLLCVDSSLSNVSFLGKEMVVECVDVWGCGGVEAVESQRRMKEWEKRQINLRRKVKREGLETWASSPDRYLLEMGGVTTRRPEQQHTS